MRAVRFHGVGDVRVEDVPPPAAPEPGWARLKVLAAGVCGSDLYNLLAVGLVGIGVIGMAVARAFRAADCFILILVSQA